MLTILLLYAPFNNHEQDYSKQTQYFEFTSPSLSWLRTLRMPAFLPAFYCPNIDLTEIEWGVIEYSFLSEITLRTKQFTKGTKTHFTQFCPNLSGKRTHSHRKQSTPRRSCACHSEFCCSFTRRNILFSACTNSTSWSRKILQPRNSQSSRVKCVLSRCKWWQWFQIESNLGRQDSRN